MTKSAKQNKTSEHAQKKMSWVNYVATESCLVTTLQHGLVTVSNVIQHPLRPATVISSQMFLKKKKIYIHQLITVRIKPKNGDKGQTIFFEPRWGGWGWDIYKSSQHQTLKESCKESYLKKIEEVLSTIQACVRVKKFKLLLTKKSFTILRLEKATLNPLAKIMVRP